MANKLKNSASRRRRTTAIPSFYRPIHAAVRNADVHFGMVPQGGKPFSPCTNRPQILLICRAVRKLFTRILCGILSSAARAQ